LRIKGNVIYGFCSFLGLLLGQRMGFKRDFPLEAWFVCLVHWMRNAGIELEICLLAGVKSNAQL
jgi:hypothetical protein